MTYTIVKFGGTSVGSPERMKNIPAILDLQARQVIVLSAVSGTTNSLVEIAAAYSGQQPTEARQKIRHLKEKYTLFIGQLLHLPEKVQTAQGILALHMDLLDSFGDDKFTRREQNSILAQGELLSTQLFQLYLEQQSIRSVLLPALEFMKMDAAGEPDVDFLRARLMPLLDSYPDDHLFLTQGFICLNALGEMDNLKRGGSDYSASLIGAALKAKEIQIWTDIDGMHNNDPRIVENTQPISFLSFEEAAELAYFGAKILHPQSVLPAQKYQVPVRILNTMEPRAKGTLIGPTSESNEIKSIAAKDGIIALRIHSSRMLLAYGFLRRVFEVFERYKTPIDMITTSEVSVSLTIDDDTHLDEIIEELGSFGKIHTDTHQTIICIVGDFEAGRPGIAEKVLTCLKHIPIRMISYGGSEHNMSILVSGEYKRDALQSLHLGIYR